MTTFSWRINDLDRQLTDGYVFQAHWSCTASANKTDSFGRPYIATVSGAEGLSKPDVLIPFENLSEATVISWIKEAMGPERVAEVERAAEMLMLSTYEPAEGNGLPW